MQTSGGWGGYVRGQMPTNANKICEGSLTLTWILRNDMCFCAMEKKILT